MYLAHEELVAKEEDVGQTLCLVNVAKGLPRLGIYFTTLDVRKLVVCQVEADDEHDFLGMSLVVLLDLEIRIGR